MKSGTEKKLSHESNSPQLRRERDDSAFIHMLIRLFDAFQHTFSSPVLHVEMISVCVHQIAADLRRILFV